MTVKKLVVAVVAVLAAAQLHPGATDASGRYSNRTLRGVYGFSGAGTLINGTYQAAIAGLNAFDGRGGCRIDGRLNIGGGLHQVTSSSCRYEVRADGSGTLFVTLAADPAPPLSLPEFRSDFVVTDSGRELHAVLSDNASLTVATAVSVRQTAGEH